MTDVHRTFKEGGSLPAGCTSLLDGQPLKGRKPDDAANHDLIALPVAWVKLLQVTASISSRSR